MNRQMSKNEIIQWVIDHEIGMQKLNPYAIPSFFQKISPFIT